MTRKQTKNQSISGRDANPFAPEKIREGKGENPKPSDDKGQNIAQNTRNQGYQQDR
jgi:hypothetical protein